MRGAKTSDRPRCWSVRPALAALAAVGLAGAAVADEPIPLPLKKPRDETGRPITSPPPSTTKTALPRGEEPQAAQLPKASQQAPAKTEPKSGKPHGQGGPRIEAITLPYGQIRAQPLPETGAKDAPPSAPGEPKSDADAKPAPEAEPTEWSETEIAAAKARCAVALKALHAVTIDEPPFRSGECGAPAPVRLVSIGRSPEVAISPPPVLTCDMVVALHDWVTKDLQPLARKHLGGEIIRIDNMSDYSCRKAYGRAKNKLSEHGRANALDIRGFVTRKGGRADVLTGWGETEREIEARRVAEEKARAEAAAKAAAEAKSKETGGKDNKSSAPPEAAPPETVDSAAPAASKEVLRPGVTTLVKTPARLGGPETDDKTPPAPLTRFLKAAHRSACRIFGTTLGPEANNAHRNHFHVDMAPRARTKFCE